MRYRDISDDDENAFYGELCAIECVDESLAVQASVDSVDINVIVRRLGLDGVRRLSQAPVDPSYYGDFSDVPDLRTCLDRVRDASERFAQLPASLRAYFDNDSARLWTFVNDPSNYEKAIELGLLRADLVVKPTESADVV